MRNFDRHEEEDEDEWDDDDDGYIDCPHCGETMLEDAEYCPSCDMWITDGAPKKRPYYWWVVAVVLILIFTIVMRAF